ncbi:hypothetical protein IT570_01470 [Candidatus Sumerlaeota bacterium]|nr:hypothetical protein [Candidatus Sumerlaeota bacterium]
MTKVFLDRLEAGLKRLIEELEATRVRHRQLETEADGLRIHCADRDKLEKRVAELEAQFTAAANAARELPNAIQELEQAKGAMARLESELAIARPRLIELEADIATISTDRDAVRADLFNSSSRVTELERNLAEHSTARQSADGNLRAAEGRIAELEGWHRERISERDAAQSKVDALENEAAQLRASRDLQASAVAQGLALATENEALKQQVYELQIKELELEEVREQHAAAKADLETALTRESKTREHLTTLIARIDEAESLLESTEAMAHVQS